VISFYMILPAVETCGGRGEGSAPWEGDEEYCFDRDSHTKFILFDEVGQNYISLVSRRCPPKFAFNR
jgi:hypothetical protein